MLLQMRRILYIDFIEVLDVCHGCLYTGWFASFFYFRFCTFKLIPFISLGLKIKLDKIVRFVWGIKIRRANFVHGQKRKKKGKRKKGNLKIHFLPTFYRELKITRIGSEIFFSTLFGHKSRKYNRVKFRECIGGHRRISLKGTRKQRVKTNTGEEYSFRFHGAKKKKKKKDKSNVYERRQNAKDGLIGRA